MENRLSKLIVEHSNILEMVTLLFMQEKFEDEEETIFVINLMLSSFITAMKKILMHVVDNDEKDKDRMRQFIEELTIKIAECKSIGSVNRVIPEIH